MKKGMIKKLAIVSAFGLFAVLFLSSSGLALAKGTGIWANTSCAAQSTTGGPTGPCDFCDAIIVTNNIIQMLFKFSIVIGTLMIVIGGITMIIATGNENTFKKGQKTLIKAVTGVAIALLSWIIVGTFIRFLTGSSAFPWNQISCTHNPQLQPINSAPNLANSSSTLMKVAGNGNYACSKTGTTWSLSDFSGTFCSNAEIYVGSKSQCNQPAVSPEQVWAVQTSSVVYDNATVYTCYSSQADCEANGSCIQMYTNGANSLPPQPPPPQPSSNTTQNQTLYAAIANDGIFDCIETSSAPSSIPGAPANAIVYTPLTSSDSLSLSFAYNNPFLYSDWCGQSVLKAVRGFYPVEGNNSTFAKIVKGIYACSPLGKSCNDITSANPNDACLFIAKSQCSQPAQ